MSGGSLSTAHTANVVQVLGGLTRGKAATPIRQPPRQNCKDRSLHLSDVSVVCGRLNLTDHNPPAVRSIAPRRVLSSTIKYDHGAKWIHYQTLDSFTDYVLVWRTFHDRALQHECRVTPGSTRRRSFEAVLVIDSLSGTIPLSEVYLAWKFMRLKVTRG